MIDAQPEPLAAMAAAADATFALYTAYVEAGFTEQLAAYLVAQILTSGVLDEEDAE